MPSAPEGRATSWIGVWIEASLRHRRVVLGAALLASLALAPYVATHLGLDSDEEALFAGDASYVAPRDAFRAAFPSLVDPVLVVVDGATLDGAERATHRLASLLHSRPALFPEVHEPEGGTFFEDHGLLYLEPDELEDVLDRLVEAQPYVGALGADPSLRGLAGVLKDAATATASGELQRFELADVMKAIAQVVRARTRGEPRSLSWAELLLGSSFTDAEHRRRILLVEPVVDYSALEPAGKTLAGLRAAIAELGLDRDPQIRVRLTGLFALSQEEAGLVARQAAWAGGISFVLVAAVLLWGLRSVRVALAILATLCVGLLLTAAFAAAAVGHLNLISVAFAVLFIGLSVDFGIHIAVAAREREAAGEAPERALVLGGADVGGSLVVCALTTAIGFYAFLFTDFLGVAELGLIAGTGMLISLAANLTLLPALLAAFPAAAPAAATGAPLSWLRFPLRYPRSVVAGAALAALGALTLAPRVHFDANPLRVRDPSAESVRAFRDLLADGRALPWNVNVLARDRGEARSVAARLEALPSVDHTLTLDDYVPEEQTEKLAMIDDAAFLLLPSLDPTRVATPPTPAQQRAALVALRDELKKLEPAPGQSPSQTRLAGPARELRGALDAWLAAEDADPRAVAALEAGLLGTLPGRLDALRRALRAGPVDVGTLPEDLRGLLVARDGRVRVEVFPSEDLDDNRALERYVSEVRSVAPDAFGEGIVIYEVGRTVVRAFRQALAAAGVLIAIVLVVVWRNPRDTLLAATPIALAALLTAGAMVLLGMPLNFANVIVIPLLLGMGVDTGVHLVHRLRGGPLPGGNLLETGTARAVLLSALTTVASFGTLGFSTHRGMASLGRLLAIGIGLILVCNLIVLPALVTLQQRRRGRAD